MPRRMEGTRVNIGFDIAKVDVEKRQVWGYATVEEPDRQGDIVDYNASIDAFRAWPGNIREQHRKDKAVGVCVDWKPIPEKKAIWVGAQVSRSRDGEDTWTKIQEGVLKGFSIGGVALDQRPEMLKGSDKTVNRITKYRLDELSIVDNPACPSAAIHLVKSVDGVSMPTDVVEKVTVSTSGNEPMAVDYGSDSGAQGQHGQTPPKGGTVQSDTTDGVLNPTTEDTDNDSDPTTAADANLSVDAPSMPTPETAKPNGDMDQRGKPINAGGSAIKTMSAEDLLKSLDGLTPAQVGAAMMQHLQEFRAPVAEPAQVVVVKGDEPTEPVTEPTDISKVLSEFRASLLGEVRDLLKADRPETDNDSDRTHDTRHGSNAGDGTSAGADGSDKDPDHDGDDDTDPAKDTDHDAAKAVDAADIQKAIEPHLSRIDVLVEKSLHRTTGNIQKALGDLLEKSLGEFEARLTKAVDEKFAALEGRVKRVESLPGFPEGSPAVRAVDKTLGDVPGRPGALGEANLGSAGASLLKRYVEDPRTPAHIRQKAGEILALEEMRGIFGGS